MSEEGTEQTADELEKALQDIGASETVVVEETTLPEPEAPEVPETPTAEEPEATPEVPEAPKADEPSAETPEEPEATPEAPEGDEKPKHPAQLRIANRELREKVEALERQMQEKTAPQPVQQTDAPEQKADPMQVFAALVTAENGGYEDESKNAYAKHLAMEILENDLSTQDLDSVLAAAASGAFGESGRDVAAQVQSSVRPRIAQREVATQSEAQKTQAAYQQELSAVAADFPELLNADSDASKAVAEWDSVFIGKTNAAGQVVERGALTDADVAYIKSRPYLHATLAMSVKDAPQVQNVNSELSTTKKELAQLKEKLALLESPEGASAPTGQSTATQKNTADDVLGKLKALSDAA